MSEYRTKIFKDYHRRSRFAGHERAAKKLTLSNFIKAFRETPVVAVFHFISEYSHLPTRGKVLDADEGKVQLRNRTIEIVKLDDENLNYGDSVVVYTLTSLKDGSSEEDLEY